MRWLLVLVFMTPGLNDVEHYVTIEMPNEEICKNAESAFVYSVQIHVPSDDRTVWTVDEARCVWAVE